MTDTEKPRPRGRPRRFDPDEAVAKAQQLFHARGYDALSVADLTQALGINPPSFYAVFGSKADLFTRILDRYAATGALPLSTLLAADRPVAEALAALLETAAREYAADPEASGCLVLEQVRCQDPQVRQAARAVHRAGEGRIRSYIAERHPAHADVLTDFVTTTMAGLSAKARDGHGPERLIASARLAGQAITTVLEGS